MPAPTTRRRALLVAAAATGAGVGLPGCAATATQPPASLLQAPAARLPGTHQLDLRDPASGHTWRIWVQPPAGPAPAAGHPVLYVLDGNAAFALAAQLARNSAGRPSDMGADNAIVVGIGHPGDAVIHPAERQRDYTPPAPGRAATPEAGGADLLLDFIAHELQPRVAQAFATDPGRQTISGHSFGGLLVLHALFTRPTQFTRYAATSPSVWWNNAQLLHTARQFMQLHATAPRPFKAQLQLRVGSLEQAQAAPTAARAAVQAERRMIERTQALADQLGVLQWPELRVDMAVLPGLDHGSAMAPGLIDALALAQQPR
ncbi:alpha/beta hydrolase [Acidovorax sp. FJL06]|uniref:alpha/beta hydrolase n=1 Tax=Acidovorax sp. FJL06 TaxID=2153365 RepID=UPI000F57D007|nr:alpha/beta hydrolase-fold protein [Acidovorax sp. FJL06]RQO81651.1 esterase [Acidovorax sp. FJL06]